MKKITSSVKVTFALFLISLLSSCFQYPEGPIFTLQTHDERLGGTWALTEATDVNGANIIDSYQNFTMTVIPSRSNDSYISFFKDLKLYSQGTYVFASHGDEIIIIYSLYENQQGYSQVFYTIRKLTDKEFKFVDGAGNTFFWKKY